MLIDVKFTLEFWNFISDTRENRNVQNWYLTLSLFLWRKLVSRCAGEMDHYDVT